MSTPYREDQDEVLRWEYKVVRATHRSTGNMDAGDLTAQFNELGKDGWELVLYIEPQMFLTFKRPLP